VLNQKQRYTEQKLSGMISVFKRKLFAMVLNGLSVKNSAAYDCGSTKMGAVSWLKDKQH